MSSTEPQTETWEELRDRAKQIVDALIARLPDELRPEALRIGYELHKRCRDEHLWGGYTRSAQLIEPTLRRFERIALRNHEIFGPSLRGSIYTSLDTIWDWTKMRWRDMDCNRANKIPVQARRVCHSLASWTLLAPALPH